MAKYVTLEGLGYFLEGLRSEKFLASANTLGAIKLGYDDGVSEADLNAEGAAAVSRALNTTNNGNAYVYIGQANDNRFGLVKTNHTASDGTLPVKLDENGDAYAELNVASTYKLGGIKLADTQPFKVVDNCLQLNIGRSLGTVVIGGVDGYKLEVKKASSNNIGGMKLGFKNSNNDKQVAVNLDAYDAAYVEYPYASDNKAGLMSKDDYSKLAGIETGANNYSLPTASSAILGGIRTGYAPIGKNYQVKVDASGNAFTEIGTATPDSYGVIKTCKVRAETYSYNTGGTTLNRYYGVEVDDQGKAFVNVPWTDTTYRFGTGLISDGDTIVNCDNKTLFAGRNANGYAGGHSEYNSLPLQLGQDYEWLNSSNNISNISNVNDFVEYGIYNLYGERTRSNDNLPIQNTGGGHTFRARLMVYDSSLPNTGNSGNDCCITQVLTLSNRVGGDGNTYIRTGVGGTKSSLTWSTWGKMQTNVEVGMIYEGELNNLTDNGMYSGVFFNGSKTYVVKYDGSYFQYTKTFRIANSDFKCFSYIYGQNHVGKSIYIPDTTPQWTAGVLTSGHDSSGSGFAPDAKNIDGIDVMANINESSMPLNSYITFVLITVNNYAVASQLGASPQLSQLLYGIDAGGAFILKKRTGVKTNNTWSFNAWEDVNSGTGGVSEIPAASEFTRGGVTIDAARQPIYTYGTDTLGLVYDSSLGTSLDLDGSCYLKVNSATTNSIGGIKIGYTSVGNTYPVQLNSKSQAYVTVPAATDAALGVIKLAAAPRTTTITTEQGGTTSNRYYGVEVDAYGKAFVNVPWTTPRATPVGIGGIKLNSAIVTNSNVTPTTIQPGSVINYPQARLYAVETTLDGTAFVCVPWTDTPVSKATTNAYGGVKVYASSITDVQNSRYGLQLNSAGIAFVDITGAQSQNVELSSGSDVTLSYNTVHQITTNTQPKVFIPTKTEANRSWHSTLILKNPTSLSLGTGQGWTDSLINEHVFWQNGEKPDFQSSYSTDTYYELLFQIYDTIEGNAGTITKPGKIFISWSKYSK